MNVKIVSEAKADFANLLTYYVNVGNYGGNYDLARRFEAEILQAFSFIKEFPNASKLLYKNRIRAYHLNRFPVSVVYEQKSDCILVLSIYDQRRNPNFLKDRIDITA